LRGAYRELFEARWSLRRLCRSLEDWSTEERGSAREEEKRREGGRERESSHINLAVDLLLS